jgi:TM2 domain-containing membrane protein YozV
MSLTGQTLDVHPPRATAWQKRLRIFWRVRYAVGSRVGPLLAAARHAMQTRRYDMPLLTDALAIRLMIPGWPQFYLDRPRRGWLFLIGAAISAMLAVVFIGTSFGNIAMGALISLHAASVTDAIITRDQTVWQSVVNGLLVYAAVGLLIYLPILWLAARVAVPYDIQGNIGFFRRDDVLLVHRQDTWKRGDIVLYHQGTGGNGQVTFGVGRYLRLGGLGIDRILAGPGDHVVSRNRLLTVNGVVTNLRPVNGVSLPAFDLTVPPGDYFIWPSVVPEWVTSQSIDQLAITPARDIVGVAVFRSYPWSRAGFIH